jgi:hypothetical protein
MYAVHTRDTTEIETSRPEGVGRRIDYIGSPGLIDTNPQAFYVDRLYPDARIDPHFHDIDQYQVVVDGSCKMGKKAADPVTFQYADAYTPYGPIVETGGEGFAFFTLRPIASGGFFAMPGNRHNMPGRAGRNIAGRFDTSRALPDKGQAVIEPLMEEQPDGVAAFGLRMGQGGELKGPPSNAGGQYFLVCEGDVEVDGKVLDRRGLVHVNPGEKAPAFRAGQNGAYILCLQFAKPSERPGSDPKERAKRDPNAYMRRPDEQG